MEMKMILSIPRTISRSVKVVRLIQIFMSESTSIIGNILKNKVTYIPLMKKYLERYIGQSGELIPSSF
jgi:hypothetical protein